MLHQWIAQHQAVGCRNQRVLNECNPRISHKHLLNQDLSFGCRKCESEWQVYARCCLKEDGLFDGQRASLKEVWSHASTKFNRSAWAPIDFGTWGSLVFTILPRSHIPWSLPERVGSRFACLGSSVSCFLDCGHLDQAASYFDSTQHVLCLLTSNALMMENPCKHASYGLQWFGLKQTYRGYPLRVVRYVLFTYIIHPTNLYFIYTYTVLYILIYISWSELQCRH